MPGPGNAGPLQRLVQRTGKDEGMCRFFLECAGGDENGAYDLMYQNGRLH